MKIRLPFLIAISSVLLLNTCLLSLFGSEDWKPPTFHVSTSSFGPGFGKMGPEYRVTPSRQPSGNNSPTPMPSPTELRTRQLQTEAYDFNEQGNQYAKNKQWELAANAYRSALNKYPDDQANARNIQVVKANLGKALTALAYEKRVREEEESKGHALKEMSDCVRVLLESLAELKSDVACRKIARGIETGASPEFSGGAILADASVVDLREMKIGVVALGRFRSPYAEAPQPVFASGSNRLNDDRMATIGNLFLRYEMGFGPSEEEIERLIGLPSPRLTSTPSNETATPALQIEHKQIQAALDRFSSRLMRGCNEAMDQTSKELNDDPVTQRVKAIVALQGSDHIDPVIRDMWEQRHKEAQQRLFTRFLVVQDMVIKQLGIECTLIFKQAGER
jgi:hypothetical protein